MLPDYCIDALVINERNVDIKALSNHLAQNPELDSLAEASGFAAIEIEDELVDGRVSEAHLGLDADRPHHLKPRCRLNRIVQQRSLADPGLATHDKRAALPGACRAEQLIQRCAFRETI
jgi:hypothetical protein